MQPSAPRIEAYRFGRISIDGETYTRDLIICPDGIRTDWWRKEGHSLRPEDLDSVIDLGPELRRRGRSCLLPFPEDGGRGTFSRSGKRQKATPSPPQKMTRCSRKRVMSSQV